MKWQAEGLKTGDGAMLHLYSVFPETRPKAILQINHGMAEHAARYERFALALAQAGYAVYAHDHRGHGQTTAPGSAQGLFAKQDGWDKVLGDVSAVNDHIRQQYPDTPIITFGHSMGSIIAFNFALRFPGQMAGLALCNAGADTGMLATVYSAILKTERFFKGSDVPSAMAKKLTFETWNKQFSPNRTQSDWLSRDGDEVDKYIADPLCGFDVSISLWLDVLSGIYFAADDSNLAKLNRNIPVFLLAGDQDPCTNNGQAVRNVEKRLEVIGIEDVTFELLKDTRHESLNELNREETVATFIKWLNCHF